MPKEIVSNYRYPRQFSTVGSTYERGTNAQTDPPDHLLVLQLRFHFQGCDGHLGTRIRAPESLSAGPSALCSSASQAADISLKCHDPHISFGILLYINIPWHGPHFYVNTVTSRSKQQNKLLFQNPFYLNSQSNLNKSLLSLNLVQAGCLSELTNSKVSSLLKWKMKI